MPTDHQEHSVRPVVPRTAGPRFGPRFGPALAPNHLGQFGLQDQGFPPYTVQSSTTVQLKLSPVPSFCSISIARALLLGVLRVPDRPTDSTRSRLGALLPLLGLVFLMPVDLTNSRLTMWTNKVVQEFERSLLCNLPLLGHSFVDSGGMAGTVLDSTIIPYQPPTQRSNQELGLGSILIPPFSPSHSQLNGPQPALFRIYSNKWVTICTSYPVYWTPA